MKKYIDESMLDVSGLNKLLSPTRLTNKDLNTIYYNTTTQFYFAGGENRCANVPTNGDDGFCLIVLRCAQGWCAQIYISHLNKMYLRTGPLNETFANDGSHEWKSWKAIVA